MENIRATEIKWYKNHNFFGFSRFLIVVLSVFAAFFTIAMFGENGSATADKLVIWPSIVAIVLSSLVLIAYLTKRKFPQAIIALLFIVINVLILTRVIDLLDLVKKAEELNKSKNSGSGSTSSSSAAGPFAAFASIGSSFSNQYYLIRTIIALVTTALGVVFFIFAIKAVKVKRPETIEAALIGKAEELKNNPEAKGSMKRVKKRINKFAKKEKYVEFCHELGVLCILDDPGYNDKYFVEGESKFTGSVIMLGLLSLFWGLLNIISLGILIPWTTSWKYKYYAERTTYSGKKVKFDGKGIQLLGRWVLWELLSIVTLGIYAFFMAIALKKWVIKHQHFEGEEEAKSEYSGTTFGRGLLAVGLKLLQFISFGWAVPFCENTMAKYEMEHTNVSGHQLIFGGTTGKLFVRYMLWWLLSVVTVGVYAILVMPMNMTKYSVKFSKIRDMSYDPASDPR